MPSSAKNPRLLLLMPNEGVECSKSERENGGFWRGKSKRTSGTLMKNFNYPRLLDLDGPIFHLDQVQSGAGHSHCPR
jgi:hypothetical protein